METIESSLRALPLCVLSLTKRNGNWFFATILSVDGGRVLSLTKRNGNAKKWIESHKFTVVLSLTKRNGNKFTPGLP